MLHVSYILFLVSVKNVRMMSQHKRVEYACFLCGDKFASELDKDYHMGSCSKADGPNSLDHSWEDPVRALFR